MPEYKLSVKMMVDIFKRRAAHEDEMNSLLSVAGIVQMEASLEDMGVLPIQRSCN